MRIRLRADRSVSGGSARAKLRDLTRDARIFRRAQACSDPQVPSTSKRSKAGVELLRCPNACHDGHGSAGQRLVMAGTNLKSSLGAVWLGLAVGCCPLVASGAPL